MATFKEFNGTSWVASIIKDVKVYMNNDFTKTNKIYIDSTLVYQKEPDIVLPITLWEGSIMLETPINVPINQDVIRGNIKLKITTPDFGEMVCTSNEYMWDNTHYRHYFLFELMLDENPYGYVKAIIQGNIKWDLGYISFEVSAIDESSWNNPGSNIHSYPATMLKFEVIE